MRVTRQFFTQLHTVRRVAALHRFRIVTTDYCDVTSACSAAGSSRGWDRL